MSQLVDDGLLLLGLAPMVQEIVERCELLGQGIASVVLQGLGDQFAIGVEVLHPFGHHLDLNIGDNVTAHVAALLAWQRFGYAARRRGVVVRRGIGEFIVRRRLPILFIWRKRWLAGAWLIDLHGIAVESRIGEQLGRFLEIEDGEPVLVKVLVDARSATDDLLEFSHGLDALIQHNELAGLGVHAGGHQLAGGGNHRVAFFRVDEVIQLGFAFLFVTGNPHHVFAVLFHSLRVQVYQGLAHAFGVVDVFAEHDGFLVRVGLFQEFGHLHGDHFGALLQNQLAVEILLVVDAVFDQLTVLVGLPLAWAPALQVAIQVDAHDFVGCQEAVFDALLQGVGVNRFAEVVDVGDFPGFLGSGGQADVGSRREIIQNLTPGGVHGGAAPVALVDHHQVEEVRRELLVDVLLVLAAGNGLVERQVNLVGRVNRSVGDLGHGLAEGLEIIVLGLVYQNVAVGQEQDAFLLLGLPQPPDYLEGGERLAGAGGHHQQNAVLPAGHSLYGAVDGDGLVIAGCAATAVIVVGLFDRLPSVLLDAFVLAVELPEGFWGGEFVQAEGGFCLAEEPGAVVEQEAVTVAAEHEGSVQGIAVGQTLLHAIAQAVVVVFGFDDGNGHVLLVAEHIIRPAAFATGVQPATHDDAASGERDFFPDLGLYIPASSLKRWRDELGADVPFT